MNISKSILHIYDSLSDIPVISDLELSVDTPEVVEFLTKHLQKVLSDNDANSGQFINDSCFKNLLIDYKKGEISFVDYSKNVAKKIFEINSKGDSKQSVDIFFSEINNDDRDFIVGLLFFNKLSYTHKVCKEGKDIKNEIIAHHAILPNTSQKLEEYFFVNLQTEEIKFKEKRRYIDGEDVCMISQLVLQCSKGFSVKQTVKLLNNITKKVAENHKEDSVKLVSKLKSHIVENLDVSESLDPIDIGNEVFLDNDEIRREFIAETQKIDMKSIEKVDKKYLLRTEQKHKIKTDTGIEISFPVDYYQNKDMIEFINNEDGTLSIELKNIGKIISK